MESILEKDEEKRDLDNLIAITRREQLYHSLAHDRGHRWKTTLFDVFIRLESIDGKRKTNKYQVFLNYLGLIVRKFQLLSMVIFDYNLDPSVSLIGIFNSLMGGLRFDALSIKLNFEIGYLIILLSSVYLWALSFVLLYIQLYFKKKFLRKLIIICVGTFGWLCEYMLFIPYIYTTLLYLKYSLNSNENVTEYGDISTNRLHTYLAWPLVFGAAIFQLILYFRTICSCNPAYSLKNKRNRMYSLTTLKDFFAQEFIVILSFQGSTYYFELVSVVSSLYIISQYSLYFPFVTIFDNVFEAGTWLILIFGVISHIVAYDIGALSAKVLLMIFVFPLAMLLFYYFMQWYFNNINHSTQEDPYTVELKIRRLINGKRAQNFNNDLLEKVKKIYTEATKKFLSFKLLFIWECLFTLHYRNNKSLALLKLSKINFSCSKHLKIWYDQDRQISKYFSFPNLEAEFLFYFYYKKLINEEKSEDLILLRYLKDMNEFKNKDLEVTSELWNVCKMISNMSKFHVKVFNRACKKLINAKRIFEIKAEKMIKKYQSDCDLLSIYGSYMAEFLEENEGNLFLARSQALKESNDGGIEKLTGFKYQKGSAIMVVSGMFGSIGDILYLNNDILDLLKIECIDNYIGTSFIQFMPAPFDVMHNDILRRYLIFGDKIDLFRPHMFLITTKGHCVEVSMHFRLVFYKQIPYFIADFNSRGHRKNLILHSPDGYIYAVSKDIQSFIGSRKGTIFEVIKNYIYYYEDNEVGKCFEYNENFYCTMMRFSLSIDGFVLEVLYIADSIEAITPLDSSPITKTRTASFNEFGAYKTDVSMEPDENYLKNTMGSNHTYASSILSKIQGKREIEKANLKILKLCSALNMNIRIAIFVLFIITFITIILDTALISNLKMTSMLEDLAFMRYLGNSMLLNIRSLDLISQEHEPAFFEEYYRNSIKENSETLENSIILINDDISSYNFLHNIFSNHFVSISEKIEGNFIRTTNENLFHSLQAYISHANVIANTNIKDFHTIQNDLYYVYYNFPTGIIRTLNESVHTISIDYQDHVENTFLFLEIFKVTFFVPPIIMIILSIPSVIILEKANKTNWHNLSHLNIERQQYLRDKLMDRLRDLHGIEVEHIEPRLGKTEMYSSVWKKFIIKIFLLQIISIIYYCAALYGFQVELSEIFVSQSKYIFSQDLTSMLSENSYFWARERYLDGLNESFIGSIDNKSPFPSLEVQLEKLIEEYEYFENLITYKDFKRFYNDDMINLEVGNPCDKLEDSLSNCKYSYLGVGVTAAVKMYLEELRDFSVFQRSNWENIIRLEKYTNLIIESTIAMMHVYNDSMDQKINENIIRLMVTTLMYFICLVIVSIILVFGAVNKIKRELIGKIDILKYF
ncbi:unnamed protein product [Blepharisma stoltei]|uniref:Uncharacterized protein n=1 Tax=Blepharisma stoltei TaxID=1481888 RepID=A0AAU9JLU4_9CILI|nr:unnamed protein product [Blepharisma stoltei]